MMKTEQKMLSPLVVSCLIAARDFFSSISNSGVQWVEGEGEGERGREGEGEKKLPVLMQLDVKCVLLCIKSG
ncbi:MAG TPA: hypothetical protein DCY91_20990 [Cyanobacteria bacterium UBA11370]|nr:hypothetical protein [Cyanobacteria bacterium UBA11370]HBY79893.1 hypothetical protein [Cyanobacteria bacterium UBA11148]